MSEESLRIRLEFKMFADIFVCGYFIPPIVFPYLHEEWDFEIYILNWYIQISFCHLVRFSNQIWIKRKERTNQPANEWMEKSKLIEDVQNNNWIRRALSNYCTVKRNIMLQNKFDRCAHTHTQTHTLFLYVLFQYDNEWMRINCGVVNDKTVVWNLFFFALVHPMK